MKNKKNGLPRLKITLKLWKSDGRVKRYHSARTRRIYSILRAENFSKAYVKVVYGKGVTNRGKVEEIYNDGEYETLDELKHALSAFTEKSLLDGTEKWIRWSVV